jgi:anaerobic selenocysteine-containing dehydrogenase
VHPDQNPLRPGLVREDLFVVGSDVAMTDSMRYADIVLPAATHVEHADLYSAYGTHWLADDACFNDARVELATVERGR